MENIITIWRPFKDIERTVVCLHRKDIVLVGKLHLSRVIKEFILKMLDPSSPTPIIEKNLNIKYYWNNGKPFLGDLIHYYEMSMWHNVNEGGTDYDFLDGWWSKIDASEYRCKESNWSDENSIVHCIALMERNYFWYKRFAIQFKDLKLKNHNLYTPSGNPRKIKYCDIKKHVYKIERTKCDQ